jgi:hypothetical protein
LVFFGTLMLNFLKERVKTGLRIICGGRSSGSQVSYQDSRAKQRLQC